MLFTTVCVLATLSLLATGIPTHPRGAPAPLGPQPLNITALTGNAQKQSVFECWQVADLAVSNTPGTQGALFTSLGTPRTFTYTNIPPKFDGGLHNAPAVQWVWFVSGIAILSLPTSNDIAIVKGGANGLILAADTTAVSALGHRTVYPSKNERTIAAVLPLTNNILPAHTILHPGACTEEEGAAY